MTSGSSHFDERGSVTPFVAIVSIGILMLGGLVVDGGRQLNAHGRALAYAQEAARAGAQGVDTASPDEEIALADAMKAAAAYCAEAKAQATNGELKTCVPGTESVNTNEGSYLAVKVDVTVEIESIMLGMIGREFLTASGSALARPISGIAAPETGKFLTQAPEIASPTAGLPTTEPPPAIETVTPCPTEKPKPDQDKPDKGKPDGKPDKDKPGQDDEPKYNCPKNPE